MDPGRATRRPNRPAGPGGMDAMIARERHTTTFLAVALVVVLGDLVSKQLAIAHLAGETSTLTALGERIRFALLHNDAGAFGVSLGPNTFGINVGLTLSALVLIAPTCRELARIDAWAPCTLGLIAGGAGGNLVSLLTSPAGVTDFIALDRGNGHELVFNLADVAAYAGLILMVRVGYALVVRLRSTAA